MKNKIGNAVALLMAAALLAGCANVKVTVKKNQDDQQAQDQQTQDQQAQDQPVFDVSDVYEAPEQRPSVDISGCDTFTQIVDKLDAGKAYANTKIWDTDVLLVASGAYEWESGKDAAIDADIFIYKDSAPAYLATVSAGGTAYPLAVKDGYLYVGGNHFMTAYLIDSGSFIEVEEGYVKYDKDGNETYYYKTCNSQFEDYDQATAKSNLDELFNAQQSADVIEFQIVGEQ